MGRNIIHKIQSQIFRRLNYFTFLDNNEVNDLACSLVMNIKDSRYHPEIIVGISRGGYNPACKLSKQLDVEFTTMGISHYSLSFLGLEIDEIVGVYRFAKLLGYQPKISLKKNVDPNLIKNRKVLVIDDDSYSGITLQLARETILKHDPSDIKIAVLHTYEENNNVDFAGKFYPKKEYYNSRLRLPWSRISPFFDSPNIESSLEKIVH